RRVAPGSEQGHERDRPGRPRHDLQQDPAGDLGSDDDALGAGPLRGLGEADPEPDRAERGGEGLRADPRLTVGADGTAVGGAARRSARSTTIVLTANPGAPRPCPE